MKIINYKYDQIISQTQILCNLAKNIIEFSCLT